jgi:hypothetical protein
MNNSTRVLTGGMVLFIGLLMGVGGYSSNSISSEEANKILSDTIKAFESAEQDVFKKPIVPEPDGPHPDAEKCICKGTGKITHGDGHTSPCPYHGSKQEPKEQKLDCICKCVVRDENGKLVTVCGCIKKYGKCSCNKTTVTMTKPTTTSNTVRKAVSTTNPRTYSSTRRSSGR